MLTVDKVYGVRTTLGRILTNKDNELTVSLGAGTQFKPADDGYYYITLRSGNLREVVKVTGRKGDTFTVVRGQDNTTAQAFPIGACVDVEWNPMQLCEYVQNCVTGDAHKIAAGTVCFTCDTCFEYDEGGHIIAVNGAKKC